MGDGRCTGRHARRRQRHHRWRLPCRRRPAAPGQQRRQQRQRQQRHVPGPGRRPQHTAVAQRGVGAGQQLGAMHLAFGRHHPIAKKRGTADEHRAVTHQGAQRAAVAAAQHGIGQLAVAHPGEYRASGRKPQRGHAVGIHRPLLAAVMQGTALRVVAQRAVGTGHQVHGQRKSRQHLALHPVQQRQAAQLAVVAERRGDQAQRQPGRSHRQAVRWHRPQRVDQQRCAGRSHRRPAHQRRRLGLEIKGHAQRYGLALLGLHHLAQTGSGQHHRRAGPGDGRTQRGITRPGVVENDVDADHPSTGLAQKIHRQRMHIAAIRPGAQQRQQVGQ